MRWNQLPTIISDCKSLVSNALVSPTLQRPFARLVVERTLP